MEFLTAMFAWFPKFPVLPLKPAAFLDLSLDVATMWHIRYGEQPESLSEEFSIPAKEISCRQEIHFLIPTE